MPVVCSLKPLGNHGLVDAEKRLAEIFIRNPESGA